MAKEPLGLADLKDLQKRLADEKARAERERAAENEAARQARGDAELFRAAVSDVIPLAGARRAAPPASQPEPIARHSIADQKAALRESLSEQFDAASLIETDDRLAWHREGIGSDVVRKLRRGHWVIQDELDLHGARRDEAHALVADFVHESMRRGVRCVRIIHGKGHGSVNQEPVLKAWVRRWLAQKDEVLAFCQAQAQDGGSGAVVVLLRPSTRPNLRS